MILKLNPTDYLLRGFLVNKVDLIRRLDYGKGKSHPWFEKVLKHGNCSFKYLLKSITKKINKKSGIESTNMCRPKEVCLAQNRLGSGSSGKFMVTQS